MAQATFGVRRLWVRRGKGRGLDAWWEGAADSPAEGWYITPLKPSPREPIVWELASPDGDAVDTLFSSPRAAMIHHHRQLVPRAGVGFKMRPRGKD